MIASLKHLDPNNTLPQGVPRSRIYLKPLVKTAYIPYRIHIMSRGTSLTLPFMLVYMLFQYIFLTRQRAQRRQNLMNTHLLVKESFDWPVKIKY